MSTTPSIDPTVMALIRRYRNLINESDVYLQSIRFGDKTSPQHLLWMLGELESNIEQSLTKKHRWLGYIQAFAIAHGITTVDAERNATRLTLNGA